jgi:EmrB/QacA subfamily drug resistance transporter
LDNSSQRWTLIATILASTIVFLDGSIVNVALPAIGKGLDTGLSGLQWVVDGYVLTLATLLILGGSLGDRYGRRRMMLAGLVGFGTASMACGLALSTWWLIGTRMLQGAAGALLVPGSLAVIRAAFPPGQERGQAIGRWSGWSGIAAVVGPLLGGWLVDTLSWRWVFFVNVPIIIVTLWLMVRHVPESRDEEAAQRLDWAGVALLILGLGGIAYGLIEGKLLGWSSASVIAGLAVGLVGLAGFLLVEARERNPMLPLSLLESRNFSGANLTTLGVYFALSGTTFFLVIYIQNVMGYPALDAGLMLAPISLIMLVLSPRIGALAGRCGPRLFMSLGPLLIGLGVGLLSRLGPASNIWTQLLPAVSVLGIGLAGTVAPLTDTAVSSVGGSHSGVAAALNNSVSRVASLLAIAGLGVVVSIAFNAELSRRTEGLSLSPSATAALNRAAQNPTGASPVTHIPPQAENALKAAYTQGFHWAMLANALMAGAAGLIAALVIRNPSRPAQEET